MRIRPRIPDQGTLERANAGFHYQWYLPDRLFWSGLASLERNEETGIEARLLVGGGIGRYFYQTGRAEVSGIIGLVRLDEWATGSEDSQTSIEAVTGGTWRIFKFNTPKVSLNRRVALSQPDRIEPRSRQAEFLTAPGSDLGLLCRRLGVLQL